MHLKHKALEGVGDVSLCSANDWVCGLIMFSFRQVFRGWTRGPAPPSDAFGNYLQNRVL